jgi:hypothetical protein
MQTFNNFQTGIAVMIEHIAGGYGGFKLTHVSFDVDYPEDGNTVIEVKTYPAGKQSEAVAYAKMCVSDTVPPGTFLSVNC